MRIESSGSLQAEARKPARLAGRPIGEILQELGFLDGSQIDSVLEQQKDTGALFGETAVQMGLIEPYMVSVALEEQSASAARSENRAIVPERLPSAAAGAANAPQLTSPYARELRGLLTALAKGQAVQRTPQRIVVTGVNTAEQASVVAAGLATTCAGSGYRTLLVDANLDNPTVHENFGVANSAGLSTLLASADPPHKLPQATMVANLAVLTAGPLPLNHSSLLARERVFHRLQPLARSFDYMIVDCSRLSAPLVGRISAGADNVVVAVKEHVSSMRDLADTVEALQAEGVPDPAVLMIA